jgi:hypothetical protein
MPGVKLWQPVIHEAPKFSNHHKNDKYNNMSIIVARQQIFKTTPPGLVRATILSVFARSEAQRS